MSNEPETGGGGGTVQRSFRLAQRTMRLLDQRAAERSESRNALVQRLLDEGLRRERHPAIAFRENASGLRRPAISGTRLYVYQVMATLKAERGKVESTAELLQLSPAQIRAAAAYYADFGWEVDRDEREEEELAERERDRIARTDALLR